MNETDLKHFVHPDLVEWIPPLEEALKAVQENGMEYIDDMHIRKLVRHRHFPLKQLVAGLGVCPLLHPDRCDELVAVADSYASHFHFNQSLDIPELHFSSFPELHFLRSVLSSFAGEILSTLFAALYCQIPNDLTAVYLFRYGEDSIRQGLWHHDYDEFTSHVWLAPDRCLGGGLSLRPHGCLGTAFTVNPQPKGYAVLYNGRQVLHQHRLVESGNCNLLSFHFTGGGFPDDQTST